MTQLTKAHSLRGATRIGMVIGIAGVVGFIALAMIWNAVNKPKYETIHPTRGKIEEFFREPAKTRLENTWLISAQVDGRIGRIEQEPGQWVKKGEVITTYDLVTFDLAILQAEARRDELLAQLAVKDDDSLELTTLAEAKAMAESAEQSVLALEAQVQGVLALVDYTRKELDRYTSLASINIEAASALDKATVEALIAIEELNSTQSNLASERLRMSAFMLVPRRINEGLARKKIERQQIVASLENAEAMLKQVEHDRSLARVVSPIDGVVLERFDRGERPVTKGEALLSLGRPSEVEVVCEVLSEEALRLSAGSRVELESGASGLKLFGQVKRIERQGFTKYSSLGVEQQRVNVIVSVEDPPPNLGIGFRVQARFFTGSKEDALIVPRFTVLQLPDRSYYVLVVREGMIQRQPVRLGLRSDLEIEIVEGLDENSLVIAAPDTTMEVGSAAEAVTSRN